MSQAGTTADTLTSKTASQRSIGWQDLYRQVLKSPMIEAHGLLASLYLCGSVCRNTLTKLAETRKLQLSEFVSTEEAASLDVNGSIFYNIALENIQYIHFSGLGRDERAHVANVVSARLLKDTGRSNNLCHSLNVLIRLMKNPRKSMILATNPEFMWKLANLLDDSERQEKVSLIFALRRLVGLILGYTVKAALERESHAYLLAYYTLTLENFEVLVELQEYGARSMLVEMSLNFLLKHYDVLVNILPDLEKILVTARSAHYLTVVRLLTKLEQRGISSLDSQLSMLLSSLSCYQDMMAIPTPEMTSTDKTCDGLEKIDRAAVRPLLCRVEQKLKEISTSLQSQADADVEDIFLAQDMLVDIKKLVSSEIDILREGSTTVLVHQLSSLKDCTLSSWIWWHFTDFTSHFHKSTTEVA